MATIHPFRAVRPRPEFVKDVACVPYDVINSHEARELAAGNPQSFLHVIRPEIDLGPDVSEYADEVYETGARNLKQYVQGPTSLRESDPSLYVYRLIMDGHPQTGIFACVSVADYDSDVILKHEKTRPSKEDDRTRHILAQSAHAEPVMLTFRGTEAIDKAIVDSMEASPIYDFVADDGVQHTIWRVADTESVVQSFQGIAKLYVADGHHRCKAASRAAAELSRPAEAEVNFFPAVLFPMGQMKILAYNRIVRKLPGSTEDLLVALKKRLGAAAAEATPQEAGSIAVYTAGSWHGFTLPASSGDDAVGSLDVARLAEHVLEPVLGITDPRTDPNIDFVGGIRGTRELERLVDSGQAAMAISMYPTTVQQLVDVSDAGLLMPPKSTWFEPKLRSGLLVHMF